MASTLPLHEHLRRTRLAEIGLTAWQSRRPVVTEQAVEVMDVESPAVVAVQIEGVATSVWLVGDTGAVLIPFQRVVQATGMSCEIVVADDMAQQSLDHVAAMIVLGDRARQRVAALLPLDVQQALPLVFAEEPAALLANGRAKQALWQQLRMLARRIGTATAVLPD